MAKKISSFLFDNLLLVVVYYLTAHLSVHFLSTPPTHAAAIWPPTGISLAFVLIKGWRVLPAIFIADLVIAIEIVGFSDFVSIVFSLMVGFQAMIGAWIGAALINRFVGVNNPLIDNKAITGFFILGGPVSMLLPSLFALGVEYWLGMVSSGGLVLGFFTWWLGGVIGVIIFAPVTLILLGGNDQRSRVISMVVPLVVIFVVLVWLFSLAKEHEAQRLQSILNWKSQSLHAETVAIVDGVLYEMQELNIYFGLSASLGQKALSKFSHNILSHKHYIAALAWLPRVTEPERELFESNIGRSIFVRNEKGEDVNAKKSADYFPVKIFESSQSYQSIIGLNFSASKRWRRALELAKKEGGVELIMPVSFYRGGNAYKMTAVLMAVFNEGDINAAELKGYVVLFSPFQKVMQNAIDKAKMQKINLNISGVVGVGGQVLGLTEKNHYDFDSIYKIKWLRDNLVFTYFPDDEFVVSNSSAPIGWVFVMCLGVMGIVGFSLLSVTGQATQIYKQVKAKTKVLFDKQQLLQTVLDSVQEGIVASDKTGKLTVFNHAAEKIYGENLSQGDASEWMHYFDVQSLNGEVIVKRGENPMLKLVNSKNVSDFEFILKAKDGVSRVLKANSVQVLNEQSQVDGVVVSFQDISREKQFVDELRKLSWAVKCSPVSILITDKEGAIEYVNNKFVELTGYSLDDVRGQNPRLLIGAGKVSEQECKELWSAILSGKEWRGVFYNQKKNGTFYWSKQLVAPILDEQQKITHFVAIQEDITEDKKAVELIYHQASHDELTGLLNRRECEKRLGQVILGAQIQQSKHVFCFLDLDQFKIVNDTCGHLAGDHLLREVCELFKSQLRQRDTLARLGGDEFGIIMEHCSIEQAEMVCNKICQMVELYQFGWEEQRFTIGVSIGLSAINGKGVSFTTIISQADEACYKAKGMGRGQVSVFEEQAKD